MRVVAVGTGQAVDNAANGDGDVLFVDAISAKKNFVADGHGVKQFDVMYLGFVITAPKTIPPASRAAPMQCRIPDQDPQG